MGIGSILSDLIKQRGTNVNKVAQAASVSPQTIYSMIKRDNMKVDIEVLIHICCALDVPVEYVYKKYRGEDYTNQIFYTPDEIAHLTKYRALDENGRELVDGLLDTLYTQRFSKSTELSEETSAS